VLALLLHLASTAVACPQADTRCPWEADPACHAALLEGLAPGADAVRDPSAWRLIQRHNAAHGWRGVDVPDAADAPSTQRCDPVLLEAVACAAERGACAQTAQAVRRGACALERNGHAERATDLLESLARRLEVQRTEPTPWRRMSATFVVEVDADLGALALRAGDFARALEHLERVRPLGHCGNAMMGEALQNDRRKARCLLELDRAEELGLLCRKNLRSDWTYDGACLAESLCDLFERRDAADPVAAARLRLGLGDRDEEQRFERAARHWRILRMPPAEALEHLPELLERSSQHDAAAEAALRAVPGGVARWARLFAEPADQRTDAQRHLLDLLARTGDLRLEDALVADCGASETRFGAQRRLEEWRQARARIEAGR
jgi:hypothetical protein